MDFRFFGAGAAGPAAPVPRLQRLACLLLEGAAPVGTIPAQLDALEAAADEMLGPA